MDIKIAFPNGNINETIYMVQQRNFVFGDPKKMILQTKEIHLWT